MYEKVNPMHPDKIADRIAGAIVDLAYTKQENPKIAVEVLIGHNSCSVIVESSISLQKDEIAKIVNRIGGTGVELIPCILVQQDENLAKNQEKTIRCGDNGIFRGVPVSNEQIQLNHIARMIYRHYPTDGKYILDRKKLVICQSCVEDKTFLQKTFPDAKINPLGYWTGGINVDTGATNRKLGSDMGDSATGGGIQGKDLSKADVSVNIYAWLKAQKYRQFIELSCAIGDEIVDSRPYSEIVEIARAYIEFLGGFEKFAEWGYDFTNLPMYILDKI